MLFLQAGPTNDVYSTLMNDAPGKNATVLPDVNVWQATLASWYYQLFVRFLPSTVLIGSGVASSIFFAAHMRIIDEKYKIAVPVDRRSLRRWAAFHQKEIGHPHIVLAVEMITATVSGAVLAIDGFYSTSNLPYPVVQYFITLLSGWSFAASLLSASVWIRHLSRVVESKTLLTRILRGDKRIAFILLAVVPIAIDTVASVFFAIPINSPFVATIVSAVIFLLQLVVSLHVLVGVLRYYWTARNVRLKTSRAVAGPGERMDTILLRLSRCALGMSLSMILLCTGTALMAVSSTFMYTPSGWTTCFSLSYNGRALDSAFRVAMFKPRTTRRSAASSVASIVPKTDRTGPKKEPA